MPIRFHCAACGTEYRVSRKLQNKRLKCRKCGEVIVARPTAESADEPSIRKARSADLPSEDDAPSRLSSFRWIAIPAVVVLVSVVGIAATLFLRNRDNPQDEQSVAATDRVPRATSAKPQVEDIGATSASSTGDEAPTADVRDVADASERAIVGNDELTATGEGRGNTSALEAASTTPGVSGGPAVSPDDSSPSAPQSDTGQLVEAPSSELTGEPHSIPEVGDSAGQARAPSDPKQTALPAPPTGTSTDGESALVSSVRSTLERNCHSCHGESGSNEGGMNYVLDLKRLLETGKIVAGEPENSYLMERIVDGSMPPDGTDSRPSPAEIEQVEAWITSGAPFAQDSERAFIDSVGVARFVRDDLREVGKRDRRFTRYFTITHLYNAGRSDDELETYRLALGKLINSLSWEAQLVHPTPVDPAQTIFRIDIRDLRWKSETWSRILAWYPYGFHVNSALVKEIAEMAGTSLPTIRADWFVAVASKPPLYHHILELPDTIQGLQDLLRIDFRQDVAQERVARAGFNESGVSEHPRIIERHQIADGACWVSHDFAGSAGPRNFFARPLSFSADGGEFIFNLPNGLQAYFLADAVGRRLDKGPTSIVKDPAQPDAAVVNGVSCMRCHAAGIIPKSDQVRQNALANPQAFRDQLDSIQAIYPEHEEFDRLLSTDQARFADAMRKLGISRLSVTGEPVFNMARRFQDALGIELAAAEVGLTSAELDRRFSVNTILQRNLGMLRVPGGTIKRDAFESVFGSFVTSLELGIPIAPEFLTAPPQIATTVEVPNVVSDRVSDAAEWFSLASRQRWPSFLERTRFLAGRSGLTMEGRNYIRTVDRTFLTRDFTFEVVFSLRRGDTLAFVGMGEGRGRNAGDEPTNSVNLRIHSPNLSDGMVGLSSVGAGGTKIGRIPNDGTHRASIIKSGDRVTFAIDVDNDGATPDDFEQTIPNIHDYAPFLNSKNTHLFIGGSGEFQQVRLSMVAISERQVATAGGSTTPQSSSRRSATALDAFNLSTALLRAGRLTVKPRTVARSREGNYLTGDFRFEVLVTIPKSSTREPVDRPVFIGIGEGTYDRLHEVERCVRLRMNPPGLGEGTMILARTGADGRLEQGSKQTIGQIRNPGTHKVSIVKHDHAVTFAVDVDNDGASPDDFESTIPDILEYASYLHSKNGFLFFGGDAEFSGVRLERGS